MNRKAILVFVGVFILIGTVLLNTSQTWADAGDLTFVEFQKDGVNGVDGLDGARSLTVSPDGNHVYVAGYGEDAINVFSRNSTTGLLTFIEVHKDGIDGIDGLSETMAVTISPDGDHVYAVGFDDDALVVFSRNNTTGALTYVQKLEDGQNGVDGLYGAYSITLSPNGNHVYVGAFRDNSVAVFSRNSSTGELTYVEVHKDGVNGVDGIRGNQSLTVSPDGNHVYADGTFDHSVAVFSRNTSTGSLTYVEKQTKDVGGVDGLHYPHGVSLSPDGKHLYVAGTSDNSIAVFSRNSSTGALTYLEVHKDGVNGVDGIKQPFGLTVSPDGDHVYVAAATGDEIAVFSRDSSTGTLTYKELHKDGLNGVDGLNGAWAIKVSPDQKHVYIASRYDDAVAVFSVFNLTAPTAPTNVSATGGNAEATVSWTIPGSDGGAAITQYTVTSSPGNVTTTTTSTSTTVTGLTNGTAYTFAVTATNSVGTGSASVASNSVYAAAPLAFNIPDSSATLGTGIQGVIAGAVSGGSGSYTAQVDWGDGTTQAATVTNSNVVGKHTYSSVGTYTATFTVTDSTSQQVSDSIVFTVNSTNSTVSVPSVGVTGMGMIVFTILALSAWTIYRKKGLNNKV